MDILQRYVFGKLIVNYLGGVFLFIMLFIFSKLSEQMNQFVKIANKTPFTDFILYFLYEIPYTAIYVIPMATLFAVVFVLGKLNEAHELYIFKTTGHSIWHFMMPFIVFIVIQCAIVAMFNEEILYAPHQKHRTLHNRFRDRVYESQEDRKDIVQFGTDHKLYVVDQYRVKNQSLNQVKIYYLDRENRVEKIIESDKMIHKEDTIWSISSFREYELERDGIDFKEGKPQEIDTGDKLFYFQKIFHTPEDLSTRQIMEEIKKVDTIGGNNDRLLTEYYFKWASPFISVILIFMGIPLATFSKQSVTIISFFFVIIVAFIYMVFFNVGISLGKSGVLDPMLAGWFANILFMAGAFVLNAFVKS